MTEACIVLLCVLNAGGWVVLVRFTYAVKLNNDALKYSRCHLTGDYHGHRVQ